MYLSFTDEYLSIRNDDSFILIGRVLTDFTLFIETNTHEYCQYLESGDLVVVSAPEGGRIEQAIILLELIREFHAPLVVLPKDHPASQRLTMVISAGDSIELNCSIQRGTHPEQHLLCGSESMAGLIIKKISDGIELSGMNEAFVIQSIPRIGIEKINFLPGLPS